MRNRDLEERFVEKGMWNKGFQVNKLGTCKTRICRRGLRKGHVGKARKGQYFY